VPRAYLYAGDFDRALEEHLKVLGQFPDNIYVKHWTAANYQLCGRMEEALNLYEYWANKDWLVAYAYGAARETGKAGWFF